MVKEIIVPLGAILIAAGKITHAYYTLKANLKPLIAEAERRSLDGVLDQTDRKACVLAWVADMEAKGTIKIGWVQRKILNKVVDFIAEKLPDFKIMQAQQSLPDLKK